MKCSARIKAALKKIYGSEKVLYLKDKTEECEIEKTDDSKHEKAVAQIVAIVNDRLEKDGFTYTIT